MKIIIGGIKINEIVSSLQIICNFYASDNKIDENY